MKQMKRIISIVSVTLLVIATYGFSEEILTNETVMRMVNAKLGEALIINKIKNSKTNFELSTDAIIKLKEKGVSEKIIEAMMGGGGSASSSREEKTPLLPTGYGYYAIDEGQLVELKPTPVIEKIGLSPGGGGRLGYAMDGLAGEPEVTLSTFSPIFIVYQQNIDINSLRLSDLVYIETEQASSFNITRTDPRFFRNVYSRDMNDIIQLNLWRPKTVLPLRIEPVEGKSGMYRLIPQSQLRAGRYAIYIKDHLHLYNMVHATDSSKKYSAFYFRIREKETTASIKSVSQDTAPIEIDDKFLAAKQWLNQNNLSITKSPEQALSDGYILVAGSGIPSTSARTPAQKRLIAERAATRMAYRQLGDMIKKVIVASRRNEDFAEETAKEAAKKAEVIYKGYNDQEEIGIALVKIELSIIRGLSR